MITNTLEMMGVYSRNGLNEPLPSVEWMKVKERIVTEPIEAFICPLPCPPLQFALVNEASPVPTHVVEAFLERNPSSLEDLWFKVAVIAICQNKRISGNVLELFLNKGPKQILESIVRKNLIYQAILSENIEVVKVLIRHFPWVLSEKTESNKEIPLYYCLRTSPDVLALILELGLQQHIEGIGGIFMKNRFGETFFHHLIMSFALPGTLDDRDRKWKHLEICLKYIHFYFKESSSNLCTSKIPFSCICFVPSHLIEESLEKLNIEMTRLDIFYMIQFATSDEWIDRIELSYLELANIMKKILPLIQPYIDINRRSLEKQIFSGTPLHYGAYRGLKWEGGLKEIFLSCADILRTADATTNLLPFMAAACGPKCNLDIIYNLLITDPSQIHQANPNKYK